MSSLARTQPRSACAFSDASTLLVMGEILFISHELCVSLDNLIDHGQSLIRETMLFRPYRSTLYCS